MIKSVKCSVCGLEGSAKIDDRGRVTNGWAFFGTIRLGVGSWSYKILDDEGKWIKCQPWWKALYFRLRDLKRLLLHQYRDVEYWECARCFKGW